MINRVRGANSLAKVTIVAGCIFMAILYTSVALAGVPASAPAGVPGNIPGHGTTNSGTGSAEMASNSKPQPGGQSTLPQTQIAGLSIDGPAARPGNPRAVLWDQYTYDSGSASTSQNFEPRFDSFDNQVADNIYIPDPATWQVDGVEVAGAYSGAGVADSVNVYFYASTGSPPAAAIYTATNLPYTPGPRPGDFVIQLAEPVTLVGSAYYWVSVQANMNLQGSGQWFWRNNPIWTGVYAATWRNPGNGFNRGCINWQPRGNCGLSGNSPDQSFRLTGTNLGIVPTVTGTPPTHTPTRTPSDTATVIATATGTQPTATNTSAVPEPVLTRQVAVTPSSTPTPSNTSSPTATFTAIPACGLMWRIAESPNPWVSHQLADVVALSPTDIWAVGSQGPNGGSFRTLTLHWDGMNWNVIPSPNVGQNNNELRSVTAVGPNDLWAVGYSDPSQTLILHWNGTQWLVVPSPNPESTNFLWGVDAVSANDVWAVGAADDQNLTMRWNGTQWNVMPSPIRPNSSVLYSVSATGPNDAWAVGHWQFGTSQVLRWDGSQWNIVFGAEQFPARYYDIAAYAPNDVWVVGERVASQTLVPDVRHWNGTAWSIVSVPNLGAGNHAGYGVAAIGPNEAWVVGIMNSNASLILRCVTSGCTHQPSPYPQDAYNYYLRAVAPLPSNEAWAVGARFTNGNFLTLVDRYNDPCGPPGPSATPTSTPIPGPACPAAFADLMPGDPDFPYAYCATCADILETFACGGPGEPCVPPDNYPYFRPTAPFAGTRAEEARTLSTAAGFSEPAGSQIFEDVPPGHPYYDHIWHMADRGLMGGYPCGGPGEPCGPNNLPYFRPNLVDSRGPFAKYLSNTAGFSDPVGSQIFEDVPPGHPYYDFIWRLGSRGIMMGYPCGGMGEPCGPNNRPYFRPNAPLNSVTRIEYAHYLVDTFLPGCPTTVATPTIGPTRTPTRTSTRTATQTPTRTPTGPLPPTGTATHGPTGIPTSVATTSPTGTPTALATHTSVPTSTPTACTLQFADVLAGSTFYSFVRCMVCQGIINGYPCGGTGEPCNGNNDPYYRPNNNVTRGQIAKIVSNSAGFIEPVTSQSFEDVLPGSTFHLFIERLASREVISGYVCGSPGEPCVGPENRPYFRPNGNATRGQLSKIVCRAYNCQGAVSGQTFEDVPEGSTFYVDIEHLYALGAINGYPCGGLGEPCGPGNRPYFRPSANVTRGQTAKIVANAFFPSCMSRSSKVSN